MAKGSLNFPVLENKKYAAYDRKTVTKKNQSQRSDLPQDYLAIPCHMIKCDVIIRETMGIFGNLRGSAIDF